MKKYITFIAFTFWVVLSIAQTHRLFLADLVNGNYTELSEGSTVTFRLKSSVELMEVRIDTIDQTEVCLSKKDSGFFIRIALDSISGYMMLKDNPNSAGNTIINLGKYTLGTITGILGTTYLIAGVGLYFSGEKSAILLALVGGVLDAGAYSLFQSAINSHERLKTYQFVPIDGTHYQFVTKPL